MVGILIDEAHFLALRFVMDTKTEVKGLLPHLLLPVFPKGKQGVP